MYIEVSIVTCKDKDFQKVDRVDPLGQTDGVEVRRVHLFSGSSVSHLVFPESKMS